jgi:hypothetical protein
MNNPLPSQRTRFAMVLTGLIGIAVAGLGAPGTALAANGVHFDPDSPAGKEYAVPVDEARNEGTGGGGSEGTGPDQESGESAPLFGEGLSRGPGDSAAAPGDGTRPEGEGRRDGQSGPANGSSNDFGASGGLSDGGDGYSLLTGALLVGALALLGVGLGLGLRGLQRPRPS